MALRLCEGKDSKSLAVCGLNMQVLEAMTDWVRVVDSEGKVIFANPAMRRDCEMEELGQASFERDLNIGQAFVPQSISLMTLLTSINFMKEISFKGRDFSVKSSPVLKDGEVVAAVEVFRDISQENQAKKVLIKANRRMRDELNFATRVQKSLLPKKGLHGNLQVDYFYEPSEQLSGDLFDVVKIDDSHTGVYICDVVGHGVGASMLTMFIKQNVASILSHYAYTDPATLLYELRERFSELDLGYDRYFSIFYGVYNREDMTFTYSNAGHNCAPVLKNGEDYKVLRATGSPISDVFKDMRYKEYVQELEPTSKLVFYTDGFTEATNIEGVEFGMNRFINSVMRDGDIVENVVGDVVDFNWGENDDDMAILVLSLKDLDIEDESTPVYR